MIQDVGDYEFDRIVQTAAVPVLVEFWQPGCGGCRALLGWRSLPCRRLPCTGTAGSTGSSEVSEKRRKSSSSSGWRRRSQVAITEFRQMRLDKPAVQE